VTRRLLREEDGIALVMALGITVVLIIFVASMIGYTSQNARNANTSDKRIDALALAESGLASAVSILNQASTVTTPTLLGCSANGLNSALPCADITIPGVGGTTYVHGLYTQTGSTGSWAITSYGSVTNPTGAGNLTKVMTATVSITGGGQSNNISVWNYVYSTAPQGSGCEVDLSGTNFVIDVPLYVTGDLCLSGTNAKIVDNTANGGQPVDVRVGGTLTISGTNATVGTAAAKLTSGLVSGGCGSPPHTCSAVDRWYVNATDAPLTAVPPTVDFPTWYANASPGPKSPCGASTPAPVLAASTFDNDTTMNGTAPSFDITGNASYNCVTNTGSLSWNKTTKVLTASGTIFFDGDVVSSSTGAMYHGLATIYVDGTFSLSGTNASFRAGCPASPAAPTAQCPFGDTGSGWNPSTDMIIFVTHKTGATAIDFSGTNNEFQGGVLCDSTSTIDLSGTNTKMEGPIVCGKFKFATNTKLMPLPSITNLPPGAPVPPNAAATVGQPVITSSG
jgi:Tfp pilus assembly protein PilX